MIYTQKIHFNQHFNLKLFSGYANLEGFSVLHTGVLRHTVQNVNMSSEKWTVVGLNPETVGKKAGRGLIGKIGYFAYPNPTLKNDIPDKRFYEFGSLLHYNHQTDKAFVRYTKESDINKWNNIIAGKRPIDCASSGFQTSGRLRQSVTMSEYIRKIKQIKELLAAGEIYQLCYCIRFRKKFKGDPYALFLKLSEINPVNFSAYLNCGDFQIISASPERFFKVENEKIITQPIKGTADKKGGKKSLDHLLSSKKERSELDMITDLERNDVGKICKYGTLKLNKERELLELDNLWHTYSEVEGQLPDDITPDQIIKAMFPGGSVTGCPKKRAIEYIEKLEGLPRNIFTGSIGYVFNGESDRSYALKMDFNIAIRTALIKDGYIEYWAGSGIVADSNPEEEYKECMLKAEKFLKLL